jgi:methyl-accepting chemotaxis protein-1 (serine sensor receptor)
VRHAGATLAQLLGSVSEVAQLIDAIAMSSHEQSAGIDEVNGAVSQMDRVMQKNAALVQDAAAAAGALDAQARHLRQTVNAFAV